MEIRRDHYTEALRQAATVLGGSERLARLLAVDEVQLERWLSKAEPAPLSAFLRALDVIADGPYARERRVRVGVIRGEETTPRS